MTDADSYSGITQIHEIINPTTPKTTLGNLGVEWKNLADDRQHCQNDMQNNDELVFKLIISNFTVSKLVIYPLHI